MLRRTVLIVGANGFVGSHIARRLLQDGHPVISFGRPIAVNVVRDIDDRMKMIEGSVENHAEIDAAIKATSADTVIWSAGYNADAQGLMASAETHPDRAIAVNVLGWTQVLRAARENGVRRVLAAGSSVVFGPARLYQSKRIDESAPLCPTTVYGLTKAMAEQAARYFVGRFDLEVTVLRLPLVFGPGRWYGGVASALNQLLDQAAPKITTECSGPIDPFDMIYVKDVANAMSLAVNAEHALNLIYHINGFTTTYPAIIIMMKHLVAQFQVKFTPLEAKTVYPLMSSELSAAELGFRPAYDLEAALKDYLSCKSMGGTA